MKQNDSTIRMLSSYYVLSCYVTLRHARSCYVALYHAMCHAAGNALESGGEGWRLRRTRSRSELPGAAGSRLAGLKGVKGSRAIRARATSATTFEGGTSTSLPRA